MGLLTDRLERKHSEKRMSLLRKIIAVMRKDVIIELRTKEMFSSMLVFSLIAVFIFSVALDLAAANPIDTTPGLLWVTIAFAGTLGLNRSLAQERENNCMDGLLLAPMDRSAIFFGKALGNFVFMTVVEIIVVPVFAVLFNVPLLRGSVWLVIVLGTLGYAAVGTLFSTMAVNTRAREVMLPILLLPVSIPVFIPAVNATGVFLAGDALSEAVSWLQLLLAYDAIIIAVSFMTFDFVVEE
jgi:heme exporter protein B